MKQPGDGYIGRAEFLQLMLIYYNRWIYMRNIRSIMRFMFANNVNEKLPMKRNLFL